MRIFVPVAFVALILALLSRRLQARLRRALELRPLLVFLAPALLSVLFCVISAALDAFSFPLSLLVVIYTFVPAAYAYAMRNHAAPIWGDFLLILWLWLPLEFNVGARWVPKPAQSLLHITAYGVSIILGLALFVGSRRLEGTKYNLPSRTADLWNALIGFAVLVAILWPLGRALAFLDPFHFPNLSALSIVGRFLVILAATALPEEILFRGFIQNALMQKFGFNVRTLLIAALIFGAAHLDNGPQPLPNWRYMLLATIAGVVYGKVFQES